MSLFIHFENFKFGVWWIQNRYLLSYTKYSHYSRIIVLSSSLHITVHYYAYFRTGWRFSNHSIVYADYTIYRAAIALLINKVHLMIQILSRLLTRTNFISNEILTKFFFFLICQPIISKLLFYTQWMATIFATFIPITLCLSSKSNKMLWNKKQSNFMAGCSFCIMYTGSLSINIPSAFRRRIFI